MEGFGVPRTLENPCPGQAGGPAGLLAAQLLQTLLVAQCAVGDPRRYPRDYGGDLGEEEEFDFVVVGAGSSGSVIASRLSEKAEWRVLLLEAGGDPTFASDIPGFLFNSHGSEIDWQYLSETSEFCCRGMIGKRCPYPRGKVLGGSSTINAMLYVRGNAEDYNEWERLGNAGWGYEEALKYFKRSERLSGYSVSDEETYERRVEGGGWERGMSERYHSVEGLLSVSPYGDGGVGGIKDAILGGVKELNISVRGDLNGREQIGFSNVPGTLVDGKRANTAKMFLSSAKERPNLFVVKGAVVRKLVMKGGRVEGVEFVREGRRGAVKARKEVVLSAGAINSPELLMLSGIGPAEHLKSAGIVPLLELRGVGENLQDHPAFLGVPFAIQAPAPRQGFTPLDAMYMFLTNREGLFSSIGMTDLTGFLDTLNNSSVPDVQYFFLYFPQRDSFLLPEVMRVLRFSEDLKTRFGEMVENSGVVFIIPVVLRPKSRGRIRLNEEDTTLPPKIFADLLKETEDRQTLLRGVKFLLRLMETDSFQSLHPRLVRFRVDECDAHPFSSDDYWLCLMKYLTASLYHPVGTCRMGPSSDPLAVVDHQLKVHGVANLRVADASVMPNIVRGNTNAACVMIGEKASDLIRGDWKFKDRSEL